MQLQHRPPPTPLPGKKPDFNPLNKAAHYSMQFVEGLLGLICAVPARLREVLAFEVPVVELSI